MKNLINNFIQSGAGEWLACVLYGAFWVLVALLLSGWLSAVSWEEIKRVLGTRRYYKFSDWMVGQTCCERGVYVDDLERFLKGLPIID